MSPRSATTEENLYTNMMEKFVDALNQIKIKDPYNSTELSAPIWVCHLHIF